VIGTADERGAELERGRHDPARAVTSHHGLVLILEE
jgi:hypothetical protein